MTPEDEKTGCYDPRIVIVAMEIAITKCCRMIPGKKLLTYEQLVERLREACDEAGGAKPWGEKQRPKISFSYVSAVLRKDAKPGEKILRAMKMKPVFVYVDPAHMQEVVMRFEDI